MPSTNKRVLIVGASFAGLSAAYWMCELGYEVVVVEIGAQLRKGGTAVNIRGNTIEVIKRMEMLEKVQAERLSMRQWEFKDAEDHTVRRMVMREADEPPPEDDYEIERDVLLGMLLDAVKDRCQIVFGESVNALGEGDQVSVVFKSGKKESFDLVLGCDGVHSVVRKLWFGEEDRYLHYLGQYFSITIVDKLLIEKDTAQLYNEPMRAVMLNAYKHKTDIIFSFASDEQISYDYHSEAQQRSIIANEFSGVGWRTAELLAEIEESSNFYFDKLCQVRMPGWSKGRVVLVGDAAYCPSPAAGLGGSLAIDGAAALAGALEAAGENYALAFAQYDESFRPYIDEVQAEAIRVGLETLVPRTEEAILARNEKTGSDF